MSLIDDAADAQPARHRRRGDDLENALLDSAWAEFTEAGFDGFTMEGAARRAGTSRAVLYRRWPGKAQLVTAAARHAILKERGPAPHPTGTLRGDLIALLKWANRSQVPTMIESTKHVGEYLAREGITFGDFKQMFLASRPGSAFSPIDLAVERGELDPERLTARQRAIAFDIFRHEILINAQRLSEKAIEEIVDQIVLPVLMTAATDRVAGN